MQNSQNKYEEEINIFTLLWFVLSKWKSILIVAIIGLVLGAGYVALSVPEKTALDTNTVEEVKEVSAYDVAKQTYEAGSARVEALKQYLAESAIMQINPYELHKGTVSYVIDGAQKDLVGVNAGIYSYVCDGRLLAELEAVGLYTTRELEELVGIAQSELETVVLNENAPGQTFVRVSVLAQNEEEAQELLTQIETSLSEYLSILQSHQNITSYTVLATDIHESASTELADYQYMIRSKYNDEKSNLETYKANMEATEASDVIVDIDGGISKTSLIKYGGVGFVGGIIIAVIVWVLIYFLSDKLYIVSDKERRFGVKQIGSVHNFEKMRGIDLWIGHKLGGVYSELPVEEQRKVVFLNIKKELEKDNSVKKIFLVSSLGSNLDEASLVKATLKSAGYEVEGCENVIGRADVLQRVAQCDAALIIENNKISKTALVDAEVSALREYVDNVIGMVVVQNKA